MLGYAAALLSLAAMVITLGWMPLPTGQWPGITLGLAAVVAGILELRRPAEKRLPRAAAWCGSLAGGLTVIAGIALYVGVIVTASRLG